jgi:hypothetical protein
MNGRDQGTFIVQYGTQAERLALDTAKIQPLTAWYETDTTNEYKWFGSWVNYPGAARGGGSGVRITSDADGNTILMNGSNSYQLPSGGKVRLIELGDSILGADTSVEDFDPTQPVAAGQYFRRIRGIGTLLNSKLGHPFTTVYYGGKTSDTVSQIAARRTAIFARGFDVLLENGGTNDVSLYLTLYGGDLVACENAVVAARQATWVAAGKAGCQLVIALDCIPVGSASTYTTAQKATLLRINRRLREAANKFPFVRWQDCSQALVDSTSAGGLVIAGTLYDNDRHPSGYGTNLIVNFLLTDQVIASLKRTMPIVASRLDCIQLDVNSKNLLHTDIGLFQGTQGTAPAGTGVTTAGSSTIVSPVNCIQFSRNVGSGATVLPTIVPAPNGKGNAQRMTITGANAGDQIRMIVFPNSTITDLPKGTLSRLECMAKLSSGVNCLGVSGDAGVQYTGGSPASPLASIDLAVSLSETGGYFTDETFTIQSPPVLFPLTATALTFNKIDIYVSFGATGGSAVVDVYDMGFIKNVTQ